MSLTYQPFAELPEIEKLSDELYRNVPDTERIISGLAGAGLLTLGLGGTDWTKWLLLGAGAALVHRGATGHCAYYAHQNINKRREAEAEADAARESDPGRAHAQAHAHNGIRVEESMDVLCPADALYHFWRDLEQLPRVMSHLESVRVLEGDGNRSHWKARALAGTTIEWDAEIINDQPGRMIAWQSLPGSAVRNAGSVWFEPDHGRSGITRLKVAFEYELPGGILGSFMAKLLGNDPRQLLRQDLASFKAHAERELGYTAAAR
ncbi:MAG: SRPBCC family protein [Prosthecobacter sp.]